MPSTMASGQGDLHRNGMPLPVFAGDATVPPTDFDILLDHVHAHAAAGEFGDLCVGGESGGHKEVQDFLAWK